MSICALVVAGALTGIVGTSLAPSPGADLEEVLNDLMAEVCSLSALGGECDASWTVPALPSGAVVTVVIEAGCARAVSDGTVRASDAMPRLHAWSWDGGALNWTAVEAMDLGCPMLSARSGDVLLLQGRPVPVEDSVKLLMFVSLGGR